MTERGRVPIPGVRRRGPRVPSDEALPHDRDGEGSAAGPLDLPGEHLDSLARAEADAAYRWAAPALAGRDVLDVGAGEGHGSALLAAAGARSVVGVDPDERAVETATRLYGERLRFVCAEPLALPFAEASFDALTCFGPLETGPDPAGLLEGLLRVLSEDGILLAALPTSDTALRTVLAERFRNVRSYRAGLRLAAAIVPEGPVAGRPENAAAPEAAPGAALELGELRWLPGAEGEDRRVLVAASNSDLPDLPSVASLAGFRDLRGYRETLAAWEERARRAEADGSAKHWELVASREAQRRLRKRLHALEHRPLRVIWRVIRGGPRRVGEKPQIRLSEQEPQPWD